MCDNKSEKLHWISPAGTWWQEFQGPIKSWKSLCQVYHYFRDCEQSMFIFRGQGDHSKLKTSLERAFEEFSIEGNDRLKLEKALIREFQRKAAYYLNRVPELDDTLGWLALMQHYGAPTRLLDWTYSFWRAVHCAVDKNSNKVEVWAMDARWFADKTEENKKTGEKGILTKSIEERSEDSDQRKKLLCALNYASEEGKDYKGTLANNRSKVVQFLIDRETPLPLVYNITPFELNDRVIYQQATFLMPGDITKCFMQNLEPYGNKCIDHLYRVVIELSQNERKKAIEDLYNMNINEAVLFPGLDGFARSLRMQLAFPHKFGLQQ